MATTNIKYTAVAAISVTAIDDLADGGWATSSIIDNTSTLYVDILLGGSVEIGSATAGDTFDIYLAGIYSSTDTDADGAIGALLGANNDETEGTAFIQENLRFFRSVVADQNVVAHWGPESVAAAFGGTLPRKFLVVCHANGITTTTDTTLVGYGVEYVTA